MNYFARKTNSLYVTPLLTRITPALAGISDLPELDGDHRSLHLLLRPIGALVFKVLFANRWIADLKLCS